MSNRLDQEREEILQPVRVDSCKRKLEEMGFEVKQVDTTRLEFIFKGSRITFYPYSGWHTGKTIRDGRGFGNLLNQLNKVTIP